MSKQFKILVTKKLTDSQKKLLTQFLIVEEEFITINFIEFSKLQLPIKNAVFTSKNSVKSVFKLYNADKLNFENVFCVGDKTANFLEENNVEITFKENSALKLAQQISTNKTISEVHFFCGNLRRNELPKMLTENNIKVNEIEVYETHFTSKKINEIFDGILFFSPSSIKSYIAGNNSVETTAFCIGNSSATEAVNYFENVFVADEPTVENVIQTVNHYFGYE